MKAQNGMFLPGTMACPFVQDVVDEEALVLRRAFRQERVFMDIMDPLPLPDDHLYERYRFSADCIRYLCRLLGPRIQHSTEPCAECLTNGLCGLALFHKWQLAHSVGDAEHLNKATICRTIRSVCLAIEALSGVFISFPGHRRLCDIKEDFYRIAGFPNVIGALVCNADYLISSVVAKWPGSVHDSRVFRNSAIYQRLSQGEFSGVLLGDRGYAYQPFLLTPFADPREAQQAYNHARTTACIEMTFGLLKARFQCLNHLRVSPGRACDIIVACLRNERAPRVPSLIDWDNAAIFPDETNMS